MSVSRSITGVLIAAAVCLNIGTAFGETNSSEAAPAETRVLQRPIEPQADPNSQAAQPSALPSNAAAASQFRIGPPIAPSELPGEGGPDGHQSQPGTSALELKTVDDKAFHPVANGWAKIMPKPARQCIHRFFDNVAFVPRFTNAVLQLKLKDAGVELARFGINSTVGMAGLFDPADKWLGIKEHDNDFGKTLTALGMSGGWFVVMPVAGPVNVRNALGHFVDGAMNPMNYLVPGSAEIYTTMAHSIEGLNERAEGLDKFEGVALHSDQFHPVTLDSLDLYQAVRANFLRKEKQNEEENASGIGTATAGAAVAGGAAGGPDKAGAAAVGAAAGGAAKAGE
jgi:ABC-type transporter lipoprotein component MlaA